VTWPFSDHLAVTPPLIISDAQIDELIEKLRKTILSVA
jgi:adenosylmethionine-8-amino-7-oxononanoate aminotransferase